MRKAPCTELTPHSFSINITTFCCSTNTHHSFDGWPYGKHSTSVSFTFLVRVSVEQGQALDLHFPIHKSGTLPPTSMAGLTVTRMGCNCVGKQSMLIGDTLSLPVISVPLSMQTQWLGGQRGAPPWCSLPQGSQHQG